MIGAKVSFAWLILLICQTVSVVGRNEKVDCVPTIRKTGPTWLCIDYSMIILSLFINISKVKRGWNLISIANPDSGYLAKTESSKKFQRVEYMIWIVKHFQSRLMSAKIAELDNSKTSCIFSQDITLLSLKPPEIVGIFSNPYFFEKI
jgi:hypothetical protein